MTKVVFDIETIGVEFDSLNKMEQEYLLKFAEDPENPEAEKDKLTFSPLTGEIVVIGMMNPETKKGVCYFQAPQEKIKDFEENGIMYVKCTEKEILENFWNDIERYDQFITFNGRQFDCPYIMIRSAILGIRPRMNLVPYRYSADFHIDLFDQLTFYGALRRKLNLHFWTKAFGIKSSKEGEVKGEDVPKFFRAGKYKEIATYCMDDVIATSELYEKWEKYLKF